MNEYAISILLAIAFSFGFFLGRASIQTPGTPTVPVYDAKGNILFHLEWRPNK